MSKQTKVQRPTRPLGDVNVLPHEGGAHRVVVSFMPDPRVLIGEHKAKAVLALDGSRSMLENFGHGIFDRKPNLMGEGGRFIGKALTAASSDGTVSAVYWAVGDRGDRIEEFGRLDGDGWENAAIDGPQREVWGKQTHLLPVLKYAADQSEGAEITIAVAVTDGFIDDEAECQRFSLDYGRRAAGRALPPLKVVLIGLGEQIDKAQLVRFDNLFEGTGIDYDLYSHGLAPNLRTMEDLTGVVYAELMRGKVVAPKGWVTDRSGNKLRRFDDGLPGQFDFVLPRGETSFVVWRPDPAKPKGEPPLSIVQDVSSVTNGR